MALELSVYAPAHYNGIGVSPMIFAAYQRWIAPTFDPEFDVGPSAYFTDHLIDRVGMRVQAKAWDGEERRGSGSLLNRGKIALLNKDDHLSGRKPCVRDDHRGIGAAASRDCVL